MTRNKIQRDPRLIGAIKHQKQKKLPNYLSSAYKLFYEEKRSELMKNSNKGNNESLNNSNIIYNNNISNESVKSHTENSTDLVTMEIDHMWKDLSSPDSNQWKIRAMMDVKRQGVVTKEVDLNVDNNKDDDEEIASINGGKFTFAMDDNNTPFAIDVMCRAKDRIAEDELLLGIWSMASCGSPSNISSMSSDQSSIEQFALTSSHQESNLGLEATDDPSNLSATDGIPFSCPPPSCPSHGTDGETQFLVANCILPTSLPCTEYNNLSSRYHYAFQVPFAFVPAPVYDYFGYPGTSMHSPSMVYHVPILHPFPYGHQYIRYDLYSQQYGATPLLAHSTFSGQYGHHHYSTYPPYLQQYGTTPFMAQSSVSGSVSDFHRSSPKKDFAHGRIVDSSQTMASSYGQDVYQNSF